MEYVLYTSGSTSMPKGVEIQHYALIENMWHIGERQKTTERDRLWLAVSLFWGLGCENALFNLFTHGGCVVLQEHFDAGEALELIEREIEKLPPNQAIVVTMRDVEGFDAEDVRNALDISETNQRVLLHRARSKLRKALEEYLA
jgi:DNA-directed RNA polymerase specialized sigma24 family protein